MAIFLRKGQRNLHLVSGHGSLVGMLGSVRLVLARTAFGHGLSYTSFDYSPLTVNRTPEDAVTVEREVTNTRSLAGPELVQLYVSAP